MDGSVLRHLAIGTAIALAAVACDDGPAPCEPVGASVACVCPGGAAGAQVCQADGTLTACDCGGALDAGPRDDAGAPSDAGAARDAGAAPDAGDAGVVCGPLTEVATAESVVALAPADFGATAESWYQSLYATTPDLEATENMLIGDSQWPRPTGCDSSCLMIVTSFDDIPGVRDVGSGFDVLAGARFRVRFNLVPGSGGGPASALVLLTHVSCAPCGAAEGRCAEDSACYELGREYCRTCDHGTLNRCECVGRDGDLPDRTECVLTEGGEMLTGECESGVCVRSTT